MFHQYLRPAVRRVATLAFAGAAALGLGPTGAGLAVSGSLPQPAPTIADYQFLSASPIPPAQSDCNSVGRRCFNPTSMQNSYNLMPLYKAGQDGHGVTIAIIDSFGNPNMASDLANFNTQMGTPHMCGEPGLTCTSGMPTFQHVYWNGKTQVKEPPPNNGTGSQTRNIWALETSLDVEWAHTIAPQANILLMTTNPAETLGVQGFPAMMNAEQFIVDNHEATVISQSFAAAEETFSSTQSLLNLRHAFISAASAGVTVLGSSGDSGTANVDFQPVKNPRTFPFPTVEWPASDPLVTGVGGTYLCTDPVNGSLGVDNVPPPVNCQNQSNREVGWVDSGGGFSHVFSRPSYQDTLPSGSTPIDAATRGVPDISYQASSRTGVLVYDTAPGDAAGGLKCPSGNPCSAGWYVVGGTSSSCPQWAGLVAIADQIAGHGLGQINPKLYALANSANYTSDFYDVTTGNNQTDPSIPGYSATSGWDPITGLGTPNAANLVPALAS